jgi:hypothetical protein
VEVAAIPVVTAAGFGIIAATATAGPAAVRAGILRGILV